MSYNNSDYKLDTFFKEIRLKKQYIKQLKNKVILLNTIKEKNYKNLHFLLLNNKISNKTFLENYFVNYVIDITFSKTNIFLHVMDYSGKLKFFCSAGSTEYKGKKKKSHFLVLTKMFGILGLKLKVLKNQPIALHLKNVGSAKFRIIKALKKKFFIKVVKFFSLYPYNGCRKKKMKRKKFKKRRFLKRRNGRAVYGGRL